MDLIRPPSRLASLQLLISRRARQENSLLSAVGPSRWPRNKDTTFDSRRLSSVTSPQADLRKGKQSSFRTVIKRARGHGNAVVGTVRGAAPVTRPRGIAASRHRVFFCMQQNGSGRNPSPLLSGCAALLCLLAGWLAD